MGFFLEIISCKGASLFNGRGGGFKLRGASHEGHQCYQCWVGEGFKKIKEKPNIPKAHISKLWAWGNNTYYVNRNY